MIGELAPADETSPPRHDGPLLRVERLRKHFELTRGILFTQTLGHIKAVDDVSFAIRAGETLGLVGESGCGKTTTSRMILNLETPTDGEVLLEGQPIHGLQGAALRAFRAKVQAVFQDPWSSLDPRMTVGRTIAESLIVNAWGDRASIAERVRALLMQVGLRPEQAQQYPHEFSGGQRQRVALAAALAPRPQLIVLDEPVSALDVSIRAQMMNLLKDIQAQDNVAYLLVAHDLATVRHMADHTVVMYLGKIVEQAPTAVLFEDVRHPYTKALFSAVLLARPGQQDEEIELAGEVPSPLNLPTGCRFHTRCPHVMPRCSRQEPPLREVSPGHAVACHLFDGD
ncbi:ABC transporter ATP-binding protein [Reyranella sp. CPCC 100927]|uniref:ABC transporter ATP-binding protein n=1 Tax=Reyranella sp. CPCC 100927 TaxID=2599616 RepID=UPI0011B790A8|nr:oligopeptide/dipeptide ABC transporter ATP-binding protein [Reyranella sp. CPCC 100927]TWS96145.1 ATP-binding cassette domain-containing protein [Reyranella sp. CPCC 100927]